jgi:predicted N-formylglutamate amidohydrolase
MSQSCLSPGDPPPFTVHRFDGAAPVLVTCDHASNLVPRALDRLGLSDDALARHIGWDIGAAQVTRDLAELLDAPAILAGYSRLVIDCNRELDDPSSIAETSDGTAIPGNRGLTAAARAARRHDIFTPYHAAIADWIAGRRAHGTVPVILAIHSFTPEMGGTKRPWHVGILWENDPRLPLPMLAALRADPALVVGDNQPYSARDPSGYTVEQHAVAAGLPHAAVELRQDLVANQAGAARWAAILADALRPILAKPELYRQLG